MLMLLICVIIPPNPFLRALPVAHAQMSRANNRPLELPMRIKGVTPTINLVAASLLGGYAFTWGFTALGIAGSVALGADFHDAEAGTHILAFLVFLGAFLWAFTAIRLSRVWVILAGGGLVMTLLAGLIQYFLLQGK